MENQGEPGRWLQKQRLGEGTYGLVELWKNDFTNETMAIKRCRNTGNRISEKQKERWMKEVKTLNSLRHPNIVATYKLPAQLCNLHDELPVICMEYCSQGDLRKVLNESSNCCGVEETEALNIMRDVASAVEYLHSLEVTHRDLKPENIVLQSVNKKIIYKLTDLGYARELGEMSINGSVVGTLNYIAPELVINQTYTCSVDYWGLGILFYEVVTGNRPFLPDMPFSPTWVEFVKNKKDSDVCASMKDDKVTFGTEIEDPTTISDCMRSPLTNWFRLALQWDPKRRGKIVNAQGNDELVVFTNLKSLLSYKIIHVFAMSLYRIDSYAVNPNIRLKELKTRIRAKTGIALTDQIISDYIGNVFDDPDLPVVNYSEDCHLIVFDKKFLRLVKTPTVNISPPLRRVLMADGSKALLDANFAKKYNRAVAFFIKRERKTFRSYVLALGAKIDLSSVGLDHLKGNVQNLEKRVKDLMSEETNYFQSSEFVLMSYDLRYSLEKTRDKTKNLLVSMEEVTSRLEGLIKDFGNLKTFPENNWLKDWDALNQDAMHNLKSSTRPHRSQPNSQQRAKLLYRALKIYEDQLRSQNIIEVVSQIEKFDQNIEQLQASLSSFESLVVLYRNKFEETKAKREIKEHNTCFDTLLYDHTVLCNLIASLDNSILPIEDLENMEF